MEPPSVTLGLEAVRRDAFGDGAVRVRDETWLWQGTRR